MGRLAYLYDPIFLEHNPGKYHPESAGRLQAIQDYLKQQGFFNRANLMNCAPATVEQLQLVHSKEYIEFVLQHRGEDQVVLDIGDTVLSSASVDAALIAAGTAVRATELIFEENYDKVFAAVRPPGHHARPNHAMGFCVFNNIALCAAYALQQKKVSKILILDWDVHHGNGTQEMFYDSDQVYYFSLHRSPFFPMTGKQEETGKGKGIGFTKNIPLLTGKDDYEYIRLFEEALSEIEQVFEPELVLISAGFDAHKSDPIGGMLVSEEGYYKMTEIAARFAQRYANGRVISFLEGGYDFDALAGSVYRHLQCLLKH